MSTDVGTEPAMSQEPSAPMVQDVTGAAVLYPSRSIYLETVEGLKLDGHEMLSDLCAVDYQAHMDRALPAGVLPERFEVAVVLVSMSRATRARIRVQVPESDPVLDSLFGLYPGVDAMEREAFDLFGIWFDGHPDLTRILMPEDWEGHPLRKDYSIGRVPVQFKSAPGPR
ncbi:MAG: NADH-quinone oxidoreductase subunit C [Actinomycetota bacterium]|nr:NADH-quinone oxidoreductase subunit C [Actinomycetota bacterium]